MNPPTRSQIEVLKTLHRYWMMHQSMPSIRELSSLLGFGRTGGRNHLLALERKKLIRRIPGTGKAIELTGEAIDLCQPEHADQGFRSILPKRCPCGAIYFGKRCVVC